MTYDELQKKTAELYASGEVYTSPDFQCDQTGGFPTSLCVCWEKQKAWLELNENLLMDRDGIELGYYRDLCADYSIRSCCDIEDFNHLLQGLGEDAIQMAWIALSNLTLVPASPLKIKQKHMKRFLQCWEIS